MFKQMSKSCTCRGVQVVLFIVLNALSVSTALASETLFYIANKADWMAQSTTPAYRPSSVVRDGFIALTTLEQVIPTAQALFQGENELVLLKISLSPADPLLKWTNVPGSDTSVPRYYGSLPRSLIKKTYPLQRQKNGTFTLPDEPWGKRAIARLLPQNVVRKFLNYQNWQDTDRFHQLQVDNFLRPKVQLQWWYFDFFLNDGSSAVMAFIPQHWWDDPGKTTEKKAVFTLSLKTKEGLVKRFSTFIPQSAIKTSADHLEIPAHLLIRATGSGPGRQYTIQVNFPDLAATFQIRPTDPPFAAFPTGVMPGYLQTVISGTPVGSPDFSYVSQIPNSAVSGSIAWDSYHATLAGQAYHEQGRLNDTPTRQGGSWIWYHFAGEGWNVFGTPGSYIYLQQGDRIVRSGFHLVTKDYTLQNRAYTSADHTKLMTGGEILFRHEDVTFRLTLPPVNAKTMVSYPADNPDQVWGTVEGTATLSISEGASTKRVAGRMFLETCSWETAAGRKSKSGQSISNRALTLR